jgi:hypothetical protein
VAWKYPKYRIDSGEPASVDTLNKNFLAISQESGALNEHNFTSNAITSRTELTKGAAYQIKHLYRAVDPANGGGAAALPTSAANGDELDSTLGWQDIADLNGYVTTGDSLLWVLGSIQVYGTEVNFFRFALKIDDAVIPESVTGGNDLSNDPIGFGLYGSGVNATDPNTDAVVIDAVVPVPAGRHQVSMVMNQQMSNMAGKLIQVQNRELIIIELRR